MTDFEFLDHDPRTGRGGKRPNLLIKEFAEALKANPNRWAVYPVPPATAQTLANAINRSMYPKELKDPAFRAAVNAGVVYVRYEKDPDQ